MKKPRREEQEWSEKSADITAVFTNRLICDDTVADRLPKDFILCVQDSSDPKFNRWETAKARKAQEKHKEKVLVVTLDLTPKVEVLEIV